MPNVSAEISLLIASDVPEALDPLEVKNSEHGGPYASRTRIGWVVNGPLGRYHQGSHATSFFVKADTELQRMVEDFYNLDFNESVADNRTELSQDGRRFMASVEGSIYVVEGWPLRDPPTIQRSTVFSSKESYPGRTACILVEETVGEESKIA